jgi:DNA-binding NarL/FixJ family response regulator
VLILDDEQREQPGLRPPRLTRRERQVLSLVAAGLTAEACGRRLRLSPRTVHKYLERAYDKLGVHDRVSAVLRAQDLNLLGTDTPTSPAA